MNGASNPSADNLSVESVAQPVVDFNERDAALCLNLVAGIGPRIFGDLVVRFGSAASVFDAAPAELREVPGVSQKLVRQIISAKSEIDIQPQVTICKEHNIQILDQTSAHYPAPLMEIYDPPPILFSAGQLEATDSIAIAIVGARHATNYGKMAAEKLAAGLASAGFTIVSGLARGIDAAAHRGALKSGGRTIAVLGGGILKMYPPEHADLAAEIRQRGAVLSEALPNSPPKGGAFPRRNRIISGMCLGLIVVEAGDRSGALISARLANEQGREVFSVPGRIDSRMSRGCHRLIRDGAKLVESVDDVLEELGPLAIPTQVNAETSVHHPAELKLSDQERLVLNAIETSPTGFDLIVVKTGLPAARVLSTISVLEIRRLVRRVSGSTFVRI
jgi:DNA processing protein